jgi:prevent-host-death family protein
MTIRIPVRQLQRHASALLDRVAAGETIEVTRNGMLVAVISPPDPKDQVIEELIAEGFLDPDELNKPGLGGWRTPGEALPTPLSQTLQELRDEEDR